jgi:hypothetical protein
MTTAKSLVRLSLQQQDQQSSTTSPIIMPLADHWSLTTLATADDANANSL